MKQWRNHIKGILVRQKIEWSRNTVCIVLILLSITTFCQPKEVEVNGYAIDESNGRRLKEVLVVNKRSGDFVYSDSLGNYALKIRKKDELVFSAQGYASVLVSLEDSVAKESYFIVPMLNRYQIFLREVSITAERELQKIKNDIDEINQIGRYLEENELASPGNPVSYFYTRFSKREERKRKVQRMKVADRKRILLKELFAQFMRFDEISLTPKELDDFIYQLDVSYSALNFDSEYKLLTHLKKEYRKWRYDNPNDYARPFPEEE